MIINILAGGPIDLVPDLTDFIQENCIWVGVDRGVFFLLERKINPDIAFGDFDSVSPEEMVEIEKHVDHLNKFKPEKDETDLELALNWALEQNPTEIRLFGASGGRLDHFFANVQLLIKPVLANNLTTIYLIDQKNSVSVKSAGKHTISKDVTKKYISFVPVTLNVTNLTLKGFKYPLNNCHIPLGSTLCISNELLGDDGTFSFSEGILIVVRSQD
ncbi:thiamine diphosphokinase [Neobacillus sp. PS3-40]|uniref:thiamine diphosphokinase n=1 Tax=Neobacillus sp. PS3-40 TaxID=3070679 RepID=UPI0027DFF00F|nr:thiamine diphosphokinase [Neobacillus sp. PS3-40]WML43661.1 thiamine diphosphokinase [Neobacillus sp. PS3-40]